MDQRRTSDEEDQPVKEVWQEVTVANNRNIQILATVLGLSQFTDEDDHCCCDQQVESDDHIDRW